MLREANRDDGSPDLFGKLKADVRVTRQPRKRSAAEALRTLSVTGVRILPKTLFTCRAQKPWPVLAGSHALDAAADLGRQRGAYVGFDQCDICGTDRAISIHVFAEIGHADRLPHL